jgi:hypothetical protein
MGGGTNLAGRIDLLLAEPRLDELVAYYFAEDQGFAGHLFDEVGTSPASGARPGWYGSSGGGGVRTPTATATTWRSTPTTSTPRPRSPAGRRVRTGAGPAIAVVRDTLQLIVEPDRTLPARSAGCRP